MKKYIKKNKLKYTLVFSSSLFPAVSFAASDGIKGLLQSFFGILNLTIPVIFGLSVVYFFWGTAQFVLNSGEEKTRAEGKNKMIWGVVALFVFVSIYGILAAIGSAVGIPTNTNGLPGYFDCSIPGNC